MTKTNPSTKYGIISDIHGKPENVPEIVDIFKQRGVDVIIGAGDLGDNLKALHHTIKSLAESNLPVYPIQGSHESVLSWLMVCNALSKEYNNIHYTLEDQVIEGKDHTIVLVPGSDFGPQSMGFELTDSHPQGYQFKRVIGNQELRMPNGRSLNKSEVEMVEEYLPMMDNLVYNFNPKRLVKLVEDPDTTVVVSHVPQRMKSLENSPDMTHFYNVGIYTDGKFIQKGIIPGVIPKEVIAEQNKGIAIVKYDLPMAEAVQALDAISKQTNVRAIPVAFETIENRGNEDLTKAFDKASVVKAVNGHFHESVGNAVDLEGLLVDEGKVTDELFWNASYADAGKAGILEVRADKVKYRNITLPTVLSEEE